MRAHVTLAAFVVLALWPATASAATVSLTPAPQGERPGRAVWRLAVVAAPGERNRVRVATGAAARVSDPGAPLTAGPGCVGTASGAVRCRPAAPGSRTAIALRADLGDRDDVLRLDGRPVDSARVRGGAGADRLAGGRGADALDGGTGRDALRGADGDDRLDGGRGDDAIDGGAGRDRLSYARGAAPVALDLQAGTGIGGHAGERDAVRGIEWVVGSAGDDDLRCPPVRCALQGGAGGDRLLGNGADDALDGGRGDDRMAGGPGDDALTGGRGADLLIGGRGDDELAGGKEDRGLGGPGDDDVGARDGDGGRGNDSLRYVPGMRSGPCGKGLDSVRTRTRRDRVPRDCEFVGAWEFDFVAAAAPIRRGPAVSLRIVRNLCYDAGCSLTGWLWIDGVRVDSDTVRWERPWSKRPGAQRVLRWRLPPAAAGVHRGEYVAVGLLRRQPKRAIAPRSTAGFEARLR